MLSHLFKHRKLTSLLAHQNGHCYSQFAVQQKFASSMGTADSVLPEVADVVIIGGGSIGCSTLYHLARMGAGNGAVLLERGKLTCGTTWHTAGLVWRLRPSDVEIALLDSTRNLLKRLEEETGLNSGWIQNGGLFIASTKERMQEYRRLMTAGRSFGVESRMISPEEAQELFNPLDPNAFSGALYSPGDGTVDPNSLCTALTKSATLGGAKVFEDCPVTNVILEGKKFGVKQVAGVSTPKGFIQTKKIINCSGVWGHEIAQMAGVSIPLVPMKHAYVVTESIQGVRNAPNVRDHDSATYFRVQGDSLCVGGYEVDPILLDPVPRDFQFGLYELDWDVFGVHVKGATHLAPIIGKTGIKSTVCGPESFTPDHKPLMGEDPRVRGLYHGCGFNSSGMMLGGGCGEQLAHWVMKRRPLLHMYAYDIRRFTPEQCKNEKWSKERSHESYAKNYAIVFPHDEPLAGRNLRTDPLHEVLLDAGCVFQERLGWERPGWFQSPVSSSSSSRPAPYDWYGAYGNKLSQDSNYKKLLRKDHTFEFPDHHHEIGIECKACREKAAVFDMSYFGKFFLTGPEAQEAVDWIFTADTKLQLKESEVSAEPLTKTFYTCMLNSRGGIEADLTVTVVESGNGGACDPIFKGRGFYIAAGGASANHCWAHIQSELAEKGYRACLSDATDLMGMLSIQGPNSRAVLEQVLHIPLDDESFPFSSSRLVKIDVGRSSPPALARALRLSFVGELGWELHLPADACVPVMKAILNAGESLGLRHGGYRALDSLSHEKGYHLWNADLRSDDNPVEAGLAFTCRRNGEYQGKDAVETLRKQGPSKRLAFFVLKEEVPLWGLEAIWRNDQVVGFLRRGEYGFSLGASIGLGYVKHPEGKAVTKNFLQTGQYEIEAMGTRYPVDLHLRSPFDPENNRLKGIYSF
ncbi:sarcosine dehydrogenase, mitochondrial isoform X1 [Hetaerina americana]|uniref:sarcosine dehydrogenase, mitochondrial isoform X1 n=1 Tax=Hetaerina americana TaxID=62018 RepID=UPI003A7F3762